MSPARRRSVLGAVALLVLLVVGLALTRYGSGAGAPSPTATQAAPSRSATGAQTRDPSTGLPAVALSDLPSQARSTVALIRRGGPYPYPGKDGSTYDNSNGVLPRASRGYYREYTVTTPGSSDRGARRIVTGGQTSALQFFYTADHYDSFVVVRVG